MNLRDLIEFAIPTPLSNSVVMKFPWLSLVLLFAAYSTFSWFLVHVTTARWIWVVVLSFTLLQALLLTTLFDRFRRFLRVWLRSDVGYFSLIMVGALSVTVMLVWFKTFGYFLVLIAAELLARLDLQSAGFNRIQAFILLTLFSLAGLAIGVAASQNPTFRFYAFYAFCDGPGLLSCSS